MRFIAIFFAVCAFAQTARAQEMHAYSHATTAPCTVHDVYEDAKTRAISSVELICVDGPTTYKKKAYVEDAEEGYTNWPTPAWSAAKRGDAVTCALKHRPFGKDFFLVEHAFEHCVLVTRKVTVEAQ